MSHHLPLPDLAAACVSAVVAASLVTEHVRRQPVEHSLKSDASPVTIGDYAAQAVVTALLAAHCPYPVVGEEVWRSMIDNIATTVNPFYLH